MQVHRFNVMMRQMVRGGSGRHMEDLKISSADIKDYLTQYQLALIGAAEMH